MNADAKQRLLSCAAEPLFYADWDRAWFLHFEVDPEALQREVPFPIDLHEGRAYVSLVAFTLRGLRFRFGGKVGGWLLKPIATHEFLNVRTYVRHRGEPGIIFLAEWLSNPLSVKLGPKTFGLPYRYGKIRYEHQHETETFRGNVVDAGGCGELSYSGKMPRSAAFAACARGSLDEFLLERYTAFTAHDAKRGFFRIWHEHWPQARVNATVQNISLLTNTWSWFRDAKFVGANYSPGAPKVWMGRPHRIAQRSREHVRSIPFFEMP
ncbi:MAG: DUF2071 domain-containing protein [Verrucomicrobiota bacterium]